MTKDSFKLFQLYRDFITLTQALVRLIKVLIIYSDDLVTILPRIFRTLLRLVLILQFHSEISALSFYTFVLPAQGELIKTSFSVSRVYKENVLEYLDIRIKA